MSLLAMNAVVERRLLVNYRIDPEIAAPLLPEPFRPQLAGGWAVAGICLIRLGATRPAPLPRALGLRSENAAHRFAVEWEDADGALRSGVYIPQRHSGARLNVLAGDRVFPGLHERAGFRSREQGDRLEVSLSTPDASGDVTVAGRVVDALEDSELFTDLDDASRFFARGADGYSPTAAGELDGLRLETHGWSVEPMRVDTVHSSYFEDPRRFPTGSAVFDCAIAMRDRPVTWHALGRLPSAIAT
jgi:hypothetical protein